MTKPKNWKKIYKRLQKDLKQDVETYKTYVKPFDRMNFVEQIELQNTIDTYEQMLLMMEELDGTGCHGIKFTQPKFNKWKKIISL